MRNSDILRATWVKAALHTPNLAIYPPNCAPHWGKTVDTFWLALHHTLHHMSLLERLHNFHLGRDDSFNNVPVAAGIDRHPNPKRATAMN
jgi:hypothetical protein